jgi:hypothetical protein
MQRVRGATGGADGESLRGFDEPQVVTSSTTGAVAGAIDGTARARAGQGPTPTIAAPFIAAASLLK